MKRLLDGLVAAPLLLTLVATLPACSDDDLGAQSTEDDGDPKFGDEDDDGGSGDEGQASDSGDGDSSDDTSTSGSSSDSGDGDSTSGDGDSTSGDGDSTSGDGDSTSGDGDTTSGDGDSTSGDGDSTSGDGDGDTGDSGDTGSPECYGPPELPTNTVPWEQPEDPHAVGATWPYWIAEDFQPLDCLYDQSYSPDAFTGRVTVTINWRATCGYCQAQASKFEELRLELKLMGHEVYFVGLNQVGYGGEANQALLSDLVSFTLLQGTEAHDLWALNNAAKDAIFIYDEAGILVQYIEPLGEISTNMNTDEGYDNVKNAVLSALGETP